jgi:hypothetical protein
MSRGATRDRTGRHATRSSGAPPRRPGRRGRSGARAWIALAIVLAGCTAAWLALRAAPHARRAPAEALPIPVLLDSLNAVEARRDWPQACYWFRRLAEADPGNPTPLLGLALAVQDLAWVGSPGGSARPSTRTSLDRARLGMHALALMDSAAAIATRAEDWNRIRCWTGQAYENLGLPLDAVEIYTDACRRDPAYAPTRARIEAQLGLLREPGALPPASETPLPAMPE